MKKEVKRYYLVTFEGVLFRDIKSKEYLEHLKELIVKYNSNSENPYFIGDFRVDYKNHIASFLKYRKLSEASSLMEIDEETTLFNNVEELRMAHRVKNDKSMFIAYKYNKDIKTLPIIYKENRYLLERDNIKKMLFDLSNFPDFISKIVNNYKIEAASRKSKDSFDDLYPLRQRVKYEFAPIVDKTPIITFFNKFINEGNKFNYFNMRLITLEIIKYLNKHKELEEDKAKTKEEDLISKIYNSKLNEQQKKEYYEELKMAYTEGYSNEFIKSLKL